MRTPGAGHRGDQFMVKCVTVFEAAGGAETFKTLVERFYAASGQTDPAPRLPEETCRAPRTFDAVLIQYWGGPTRTAPSAATRACACDTSRS